MQQRGHLQDASSSSLRGNSQPKFSIKSAGTTKCSVQGIRAICSACEKQC